MTDTRKTYPRQERILKTLNCCIYCGTRSDSLQDEHIIPFGLHGRWILAKASCHGCAAITSRFEKNFLRQGMLAVRTALRYPTRRPRERPKQFPLIIKKNGQEQTIDVPIEEYMPIIVLPVFDVPGYVENRDKLQAIGLTAPVQVGGPSLKQLAEKYGPDGGVQVTYQGYAFAQLLAKLRTALLSQNTGWTKFRWHMSSQVFWR